MEVIKIKTLRQLYEQHGVTRRTIQWYEEKGLLHWTEKTPSNVLLYNEQEETKLYLIQIFIEVGYSLDEIKNILDSPGTIHEAWRDAVQKLEEKKARIDGMIQFMNLHTAIDTLPSRIASEITTHNIDTIIPKGISYKDLMSINIDLLSYMRSIDFSDDEFKSFLQIYILIDSILFLLKLYQPDDEKVQSAIRDCLEHFRHIPIIDSETENMTEGQILDYFKRGTEFYFAFLGDFLEDIGDSTEGLSETKGKLLKSLSIYECRLGIFDKDKSGRT